MTMPVSSWQECRLLKCYFLTGHILVIEGYIDLVGRGLLGGETDVKHGVADRLHHGRHILVIGGHYENLQVSLPCLTGIDCNRFNSGYC